MMKANKIRSYGRFSSEAQQKGVSLERQMEETQEALDYYIKRNPRILESHDIDTKIWFDKAVSGYSEKKNNHNIKGSQWNAMLKEVKAGDIIVIESLSRFTRQKAHRAMVLIEDYMEDYGISFIIKQSNQILTKDSFTDDSFNDFQTYLQAKQNNKYVKELSERLILTHKVNKRSARDGKKIYHQCKSHGWLEWKEGKYIIRGNEKQTLNTLNKIYTLTLDGYGVKRVCKYLNSNIKEYPILTKMKKDRSWTVSYIWRTLRSKAVLGYNEALSMEHKQYPQVIDDILFYAVQKHLLCPKKTGRVGNNIHLFTGLIKCSCGKNYKSDNRKHNQDSNYICDCKEYKKLGPHARTEGYVCNDSDNAVCESPRIQEDLLLYGMKAIMADSTFVTASLVNNISSETSSSIERGKAEVEAAKAQEIFTIISNAYDVNPSSNILLKKLTDAETKLNEYKMILSDKLNTSDAVLIESYNKEIDNIYNNGFNQNSKQLHQNLLRKLIDKIEIKSNIVSFFFNGMPNPIRMKFNKECIWYKNNLIVPNRGSHRERNNRNGNTKIYAADAKDHPSVVFTVRNIRTEESFTGTRKDFIIKQSLSDKRWKLKNPDLCALLRGERLSVLGWILKQ